MPEVELHDWLEERLGPLASLKVEPPPPKLLRFDLEPNIHGLNQLNDGRLTGDLTADDVATPLLANNLNRGHDVAPGPMAYMATQGLVLSNPSDEVRAYPDVFPEGAKAARQAITRKVVEPTETMLSLGGIALDNAADATLAFDQKWRSPEAFRKAARRAKCRLSPAEGAIAMQCPQPRTLATISYQRRGAGMRPASGQVDLSRVPDPKAWLEKRLGPLSWFTLDPPLGAPSPRAPEAPHPTCPLDMLHPLRPDAGPDVVLLDPEGCEDGDWLVRLDGSLFAADPDEADLQGPPAVPVLDRAAARHDPGIANGPSPWP